MWYSWASSDRFDAWHDTVCAALGLPKPGRNAATGEIDLDAQWTTAYTVAVEVTADDWRAVVEDEIAAAHPAGLGVPCDPPPTLDDSLP